MRSKNISFWDHARVYLQLILLWRERVKALLLRSRWRLIVGTLICRSIFRLLTNRWKRRLEGLGLLWAIYFFCERPWGKLQWILFLQLTFIGFFWLFLWKWTSLDISDVPFLQTYLDIDILDLMICKNHSFMKLANL